MALLGGGPTLARIGHLAQGGDDYALRTSFAFWVKSTCEPYPIGPTSVYGYNLEFLKYRQNIVNAAHIVVFASTRSAKFS
jgi:hypothetical protein